MVTELKLILKGNKHRISCGGNTLCTVYSVTVGHHTLSNRILEIVQVLFMYLYIIIRPNDQTTKWLGFNCLIPYVWWSYFKTLFTLKQVTSSDLNKMRIEPRIFNKCMNFVLHVHVLENFLYSILLSWWLISAMTFAFCISRQLKLNYWLGFTPPF